MLFQFIHGCSISLGSSNLDNSYLLEINQIALPEGNPQTFVLKDQKFFIYQSDYDEQHQLIKKLVCKRTFDENSFKKIVDLSSNLFQLDSNYVKASLDGIIWDVTLFSQDDYKVIHVKNVLPDEIVRVFKEINLLIPYKKPKIMLGRQ